jgi:DNA-binding FadR family transcriptional regulator
VSTGREAVVEPPSTRDRVVEHVRRLIVSGSLKRGDRLPGERDLAHELGVSRPSVRSGLEALEAMGVVVSRRGAGTFIANGPPDLGREPLSLLASLHGFSANEMSRRGCCSKPAWRRSRPSMRAPSSWPRWPRR